jgi:predicted O-linked N-acetylglucosamine transferase (SPINDLY family)
MRVSISDALRRVRAHLMAGQWAEAEAICRAIIASASEEHEAHLLLGAALQMAGRFAEAEAACRQALDRCPTSAVAWTDLAVALGAQGRLTEAEAAYRQALELDPSQPAATFNLGRILHRQNRLAEAEAAYSRAVDLQPGYTKAEYNRAIVYQEFGRYEEAEAEYRRILATAPRFAPAANNLGNLLRDQSRTAEAVACYRHALEVAPAHFHAQVNLGLALCDSDRLSEAEGVFLDALQLHPNTFEPLAGLGQVYRAAGQLDQAEHWLRRALEVRPDSADASSSLLFSRQYRPGVTAEELARLHGEWDARCAQPLRALWRPHENDFQPDRPLRVGFISADLAEHPVGHMLIGVLESLAGLCRTTCYYDRPRRDPLVARFRAAAGAWREVYAWSDERLADQVRDDRIDILFDLAGHSGDHRLLVFARKPAPLQATWIGYPGTTGLRAMDYIVADRHQIPEGEEPHYSESVLRLPDSYVALGPVDDAGPVGPLPAATTGRVTLASFSNPLKIAPQVVGLWSRVLARIPGSRMLLKYPGLDDRLAADRLRRDFAVHGISADRVQIEGRAPRADLLAAYNRVDIALDTFPYSGGLTTFEALWMGVPVVTWPGRTFAGRHALSYLSTAGLGELVAGDESDYVERVAALATDLARLAGLRETLRSRVAASPLCDPARLAGHLMELLREAWRRCCQRPGMDRS